MATKNFMAMLALHGPMTVDARSVAAQIREMFPTFSVELTPLSAGGSSKSPLLIRAGAITIAALFFDEPIPDGTLEQAIKADRLWPDAEKRISQHKAHIVVSCIGDSKQQEDALVTASILQVVTAGLAYLLPAIGVYWSTGDTISETSMFVRQTKKFASDGQIPTDLWVQLKWLDGPPASDGRRALAVLTTGLLPFVGREIELEPVALPPGEIAKRIIGLSAYLIAQGSVVKNGDTVGLSSDEKILVKFRSQGMRLGVPVMVLNWINERGAS